MKKPTMMRLDVELIEAIEAYRVKTGIKTTSEATRRLIARGLSAPPTRPEMVAEALARGPSGYDLVGEAIAVKPDMFRPAGGKLTSPVDISGKPVPKRGALPKGGKK